jgi:nitrilase
MIDHPRCRVAAAHVAPVYFDIEKTVEKTCKVIEDAAKQGVQLIAFPESFLPGYPHWGEVVPPMETDGLFTQMAERGIRIDGSEIRRIRAAAATNKMVVSVGFNEGTDISVGCLWNANVLIGSDGTILSHHRKLVPTSVEKLVWTNGDSAGLKVSETGLGRVGMLICGENTNPLARYTLISQGEQIHISSYPAVFPAKSPNGSGAFDIQDAIRIRAANHAFEGKLFNIVAASPFDDTARQFLSRLPGNVVPLFECGAQSTSMIIGPGGKVISDVFSSEEGLCVADINLGDSVVPKRMHDIVGYYNRYDVFDLNVTIKRDSPVKMKSSGRSADEILHGRCAVPDRGGVFEIE